MNLHNVEQYEISWQILDIRGGVATNMIVAGKADAQRLVDRVVKTNAFNLNVHQRVDVSDEFLPTERQEA